MTNDRPPDGRRPAVVRLRRARPLRARSAAGALLVAAGAGAAFAFTDARAAVHILFGGEAGPALTAVLLLWFAGLASFALYPLIALPGLSARREAAVGATGIEITERGLLWHRGRRITVPWDAVTAVVPCTGPCSSARRDRLWRMLDLHLRRPVQGVPPYARTSPAGPGESGAHRLRLGAGAAPMEDAVRQVAELAAVHRPDLFASPDRAAKGSGRPWFTPSRPASPAAGPLRPPFPRAPEGPVTVSYDKGVLLPVGSVLGQAAVPAALALAAADPFGWPGGVRVAVGVVLGLPFLVCLVTLPVSLFRLPRSLGRRSIAVGSEGLVLTGRRRLRPWTAQRTSLPWHRVQALTARRVGGPDGHVQVAVLVGPDGADAPPVDPGTGLPLAVSLHHHPGGLREAPPGAEFPVTVLRTRPYRGEERGRALWEGFARGGPAPRTVPPHQLRAALAAFRPDLCRGFEDLWGATAPSHR
ncbi:hypothetical protein [Nocardiopsis halophila]|uniref:hypothetical protein n=1 Tax=Nocardiopsis halophila TaxID=141692 RepID=UPI0003489E70|nr:hypothetical protein [Nocardiopsis halophila]